MCTKKKIMIVGSHTITGIDHTVKMKISNLCDRGWYILVGDHFGLDSALQRYLVDMHTDRVCVYTARDKPRSNLGRWPVRFSRETGRREVPQKFLRNTIAMADDADCGMTLWDCSSLGTYHIIATLLGQGKSVWVYMPDKGVGHTLRTSLDMEKFIRAYFMPPVEKPKETEKDTAGETEEKTAQEATGE